MNRDRLRDKLNSLKSSLSVDDMEYAVEWFKEELNRCDVCEQPIKLKPGMDRDVYELVDKSEDTVVMRICDHCVEDIFEEDTKPSEVYNELTRPQLHKSR